MHTIGYDLGSSFVKASLLDVDSGAVVASASYPDDEMPIISLRPGWAEQHPDAWWDAVKQVTARLAARSHVPLTSAEAIGISYQMHGLVLVDRGGAALRPAIIWCDSRAAGIGKAAFAALGEARCLREMLNSPGNFTASKLAWVREHEPAVYERAFRVLLPGDFVALRMTGEFTTTVSGLSEGILWNFPDHKVAGEVLRHFGLRDDLIAAIVPNAGVQGRLTTEAARDLGLSSGTLVSYRAGDQPNNALSLNVLEPGEIAATAGTSGVVYAVTNLLVPDPLSRINCFAHITHSRETPRVGILLCINGTGSANRWIRRIAGGALTSYEAMNDRASGAPVGSNGLSVLPFGNGAERMFGDRDIGASVIGAGFNLHADADLFRAFQEGVAFSFAYGIDLMRSLQTSPHVLRVGHANMFLSPVFRTTLANTARVAIELFNTDGAQGAARGAAIGAGAFASPREAFRGLNRLAVIEPVPHRDAYLEAFALWRQRLETLLSTPG